MGLDLGCCLSSAFSLSRKELGVEQGCLLSMFMKDMPGGPSLAGPCIARGSGLREP